MLHSGREELNIHGFQWVAGATHGQAFPDKRCNSLGARAANKGCVSHGQQCHLTEHEERGGREGESKGKRKWSERTRTSNKIR